MSLVPLKACQVVAGGTRFSWTAYGLDTVRQSLRIAYGLPHSARGVWMREMQRFATRLSIFYGAYFLVMGIQLPFLPIWLEGRGLSAQEIAIIVAAPMVVRVVFTPLMALSVGRLGGLRQAIAWFSWLGAMAITALILVDGFVAILIVVLIATLFWNPVLPVTEALAMAGVRRGLSSYGRMRLWGSLSFIVANLGGGFLLSKAYPEHILWALIATFLLTALAAMQLVEPPDDTGTETPPATSLSMRETIDLMRYAPLVAVILAASLVNASHGVYYAFGTVHWTAAGIGLGLAGVLWAIGVVAEIGLFAVSRPAVRAFTAIGLILLAGVAGVVRWTAFAFDPGLTGLFVLQTLHAFTFGAMHLGIVHAISELAPERSAAAAQAFHFTVSGLILGGTTFFSGPLYEAHGAGAYLAMAGFAGAGCLVGALAMVLKNRMARNPLEASV